MKILVTGANGYIGGGVVKKLLNDGMNVVATDFSDDGIDSRADIKVGNIFEIEDPYNYFGQPDVLLHLAWRDGFQHSSINHINDLPKHYAFITSLIESGVAKVSVMGSMHEVGFYEGSIDENTPTNPLSLYGISKDALRRSVEIIAKEHNTIFQWIRGFYIVGNTEKGSSIFSKIVQSAKSGKQVFPFTMGLNQFDFLDYDEFCDQIAAVVEQKEINGIINCCQGRPKALGMRVEEFIKENGYDIQLQYGAFPDRPYDSKAIWGNNEKIREILEKRG